jgi:PPOX class probable F420-dependent enzyme
MTIDPDRLAAAIPRLEREQNIWIATTRPDGRPHLVPIWFVWHDEKVWICTPRASQKVKNLAKNAQISLALEDGLNPVIFEGTAALRLDPPWPDQLAPVFEKKYDWDFRVDNTEDYILVEITPMRMIHWE